MPLFLDSTPSRLHRHRQLLRRLLVLGLALIVGSLYAPRQLHAADNPGSERRLKIVFEINSGTDVAFEIFLANMEGLQKNFSDLADIAVVATSEGTGLLRTGNNPFESRLAKLADRGIDFMVCRAGLQELEVEPAELLGFARTVRSGGDEVEKLKEQGWAHVGDGETYVSHF